MPQVSHLKGLVRKNERREESVEGKGKGTERKEPKRRTKRNEPLVGVGSEVTFEIERPDRKRKQKREEEDQLNLPLSPQTRPRSPDRRLTS